MATTKTAKVLTGKAIAKMIAWLETRPTDNGGAPYILHPLRIMMSPYVSTCPHTL
jgi:hypothetical protein